MLRLLRLKIPLRVGGLHGDVPAMQGRCHKRREVADDGADVLSVLSVTRGHFVTVKEYLAPSVT